MVDAYQFHEIEAQGEDNPMDAIQFHQAPQGEKKIKAPPPTGQRPPFAKLLEAAPGQAGARFLGTSSMPEPQSA
jgi:hypothetical protein